MKSRMSSWASFFTLGGMSPSTCGEGEEAKGLRPLRAVSWAGAWRGLIPFSRWRLHHHELPCTWESSCGNRVSGTHLTGSP